MPVKTDDSGPDGGYHYVLINAFAKENTIPKMTFEPFQCIIFGKYQQDSIRLRQLWQNVNSQQQRSCVVKQVDSLWGSCILYLLYQSHLFQKIWRDKTRLIERTKRPRLLYQPTLRLFSMEKTFAPQLNPLFTEFSQTVNECKQNDGTHVDFDLYLQGEPFTPLDLLAAWNWPHTFVESTPLQYCTDNENAFYKSAHIDFPKEMARQLDRKNTWHAYKPSFWLTHGPFRASQWLQAWISQCYQSCLVGKGIIIVPMGFQQEGFQSIQIQHHPSHWACRYRNIHNTPRANCHHSQRHLSSYHLTRPRQNTDIKGHRSGFRRCCHVEFRHSKRIEKSLYEGRWWTFIRVASCMGRKHTQRWKPDLSYDEPNTALFDHVLQISTCG